MIELFKLATSKPNRRSDNPVIEQLFELSDDELKVFELPKTVLREKVLEAVLLLEPEVQAEWLPDIEILNNSAQAFAWLYCAAAVLLQRATGHTVSEIAVFDRQSSQQAHGFFEHEEKEVGEAAGELALSLLKETFGGLEWESGPQNVGKNFNELYAVFAAFSVSKVLPADTAAIVEAANRLNVPCTKLDRFPYKGVTGNFRIRQNSMLMLGQGRHNHLIDGTMCVDLSQIALNMRTDQHMMYQWLIDLLPEPIETNSPAPNSGIDFNIIVSNHSLVAIVPDQEVHESISTLAIEASKQLDVGLLTMTVNSSDPSLPLDETSGAVLNINTAPELDKLLNRHSSEMKAAAEGFVRWVFPEGTESRIKVVAITGTNGKTTTSRMTNRILRHDAHRTSLVCSDGLYLNDQKVEEKEIQDVDPFVRSFELSDVEVAIQETYFGYILRNGFPYLKSDVAVCTNVTGDHIGRLGVETIEEMAEVKFSVLQRATKAVVLNYDNPYCRAMIPRLQGRLICLVSANASAEELKKFVSDEDVIFILENIDGQEWIVMYAGDRVPVIEVSNIPATFNGTARFNIDNAMCAAAAAHASGASLSAMKSALSGYEMTYENSPGRVNIYNGHPFMVIMDFAHSDDAYRVLGDFVAKQDIKGRKILLIASTEDRRDEALIENCKVAKLYFDHLVIRNYPEGRSLDRSFELERMTQCALKSGWDSSQMTVEPNPDKAIQEILSMGEEDDCLVMTWGNSEVEKMWTAITSFQPTLK